MQRGGSTNRCLMDQQEFGVVGKELRQTEGFVSQLGRPQVNGMWGLRQFWADGRKLEWTRPSLRGTASAPEVKRCDHRAQSVRFSERSACAF